MYINLHTHHPTLAPGNFEIESVYFGQSKTPEKGNHSVGLHPWYLDGIDLDAAAHWLSAQAVLPTTRAIGEAGLDKICQSAWDVQVQAFERCIQVAETSGKPLIIHCVRAFSEILALKKAWKPKQPWVFHGFDKKQSIADRLLQAGCYLSFGAALLRENSPALACLRATPPERFFLETDDASAPIEAIYEKASLIRGISLDSLQQILTANLNAILLPA